MAKVRKAEDNLEELHLSDDAEHENEPQVADPEEIERIKQEEER